MRIRRSRCLIAFWADGRFSVENYLIGKRTAVSAPVAQVLDELNDYEEIRAVESRLAIPEVGQLLAKLIAQDVVVCEESPVAQREELLESTWEWGLEARYFHFATNDLDFISDPREQQDYLLRRASQVAPPSPYKEYQRPGTDLGRSRDQQSSEFWQVLSARRTCRSFTGASITRADFADILLWTWGRSAHLSYPQTGDFVVKTSPSGGARHPIEVYPMVLAVQDVEPGIYHYSVKRNIIVPLTLGDLTALVEQLCSDQVGIRNAAAVFFMTAVVERSSWKYPSSHAYRVLQLDAGHLGQTFHLICTRLGLGPFTFAATRNPAIERTLGIDGIDEIVLYTAAVGVPANEATGTTT